ncbi:MAG: glycosyltransferase family 9 protein [Burkholderiales bacterium]|nr:glycosyltransferase family 9 protein [Burkholderiales bacterium]
MRYASVALAIARWGFRRRRPPSPSRILVLHHLLLGDTLMLTALLAKLRAQHPDASIVMTVDRAYVPLYAGRPYGVDVLAFDPRDFGCFTALLTLPRFDLAILPADNRWSWLARAIGVRWIVGIAGDRPAHKNWPVDQLVGYSPIPTAFCDTAAELVAGAAPARYRRDDWWAPAGETAVHLPDNCAILHVGASSRLKLWPAERWRALAQALEARGLSIVWSAGPGEAGIIDAIEADPVHARIAGTLTLERLWRVLARAQLLVCPDTGIAHLGRIVGVPTVTLFGPGSALICGAGSFFADMPYRAVTVAPFPCRDQTIQFFREVSWARRCERLYGDAPGRCPRPRCMEAIAVADVVAAVDSLDLAVRRG